MSKKIKNLYSYSEIKIIVNNCKTTKELLYVCLLFRFLIFFGDLEKSLFLKMITQLRFRELENLNL